MYLAYVDESGDKGAAGSQMFVLGVVLLPAATWPSAFDDLIGYRRWVRDRFGVPVRAELKANYLLRNGGPLRATPLSEAARHRLYRGLVRMIPKIGAQCFAVAIDKQGLARRKSARDPFEVAWEYTLQRFERFTTISNTPLMLVHDEGEPDAIRKLARKARRAGTAGSAFGTGYLNRPAKLLVDDPVSRVSTQSYFLQLADLVAYAAFRQLIPPPKRRVQIVPQSMWFQAGSGILTAANRLAGGPPGIVVYPKMATPRPAAGG